MKTTTLRIEQLDGSLFVIKMEKGLWVVETQDPRGKITYQSKTAQTHKPLTDVVNSAVFHLRTEDASIAVCTMCKFPVSQSRETLVKREHDQWDHVPGGCPIVREHYFEIN